MLRNTEKRRAYVRESAAVARDRACDVRHVAPSAPVPPRRPTRALVLAEPRDKTAIRINGGRSARIGNRDENESSRTAIPSAEIVSTRLAHVKSAYGVAPRWRKRRP